MAVRSPTVMVSSTFYDLRQVRADLTEFLINQMGYTPLLSELNSFPIDPELETTANCQRRVEEDADILVLLVGGRYGYVDVSSAKSITNLEYLAARAKGIPIYAFVKRGVLSSVSLWQANPTADFSSIVDDSRVFQFINEVRAVDKVWTHEFDTAQEIVATLRTQFAVRMHEGLSLIQKTTSDRGKAVLRTLHGKALRLAMEKSHVWEYRLLFQIALDELAKHAAAKRDHDLGLALGVASYVSVSSWAEWVALRVNELRRVVDALEILLNRAAGDAVGPLGEPGDVEKIAFVGRRIGNAYLEALEWSQRVRCTAAEEGWAEVLREMDQFSDGLISNIESWAKRGQEGLEAVLPRIAAGERPELDFTLNIALGGSVERFSKRLDELVQQLTGPG